MRCIKLAILVWFLLLPLVAYAEGVLTPAANPPDRSLYNYHTSLHLQDDFVSGSLEAGETGSLGWVVAGGTTTQAASIANRLGLLSRDTSSSINTLAYTQFQGSSNTLIDPSIRSTVTFIHRLTTSDANTVFWTGMANLASAAVPDDGIYFEKRAADTNWFCITRASASETRTDSGVTISTTPYYTFTQVRTGSNVQFFINGALVCTHTATIPTVFLSPAWLITNTAAAAKISLTDYFEIQTDGLTR